MEFLKNFFLVRFHSLRKNDPKEMHSRAKYQFCLPQAVYYLFTGIYRYRPINKIIFILYNNCNNTWSCQNIKSILSSQIKVFTCCPHFFFNEDNNFHKITRTSKYPIMNRVLQINHANISPFRINTDNHVNFHMHMLCCRRLKVAPNF